MKTVVVTGMPPYQGADLSEAAVAAWTHDAGPNDLVEVKTGLAEHYFNSGDRRDLMGGAAGPVAGASGSGGGGASDWWDSIAKWVLVAVAVAAMVGLLRAFRHRILVRRRSGDLAPLAPDPDEAKAGLEAVGKRVAKTGLASVPAEVASAANAPAAGEEPVAGASMAGRSSEATAQDVLDVLELMLTSSIDPVWLTGGWAADALAGRQRRRQTGIEIVVGAEHFALAVERFADVGFRALERGTTPHGRSALLVDRNGLRVRLTSFAADPERSEDVVVLADGRRVERDAIAVGSVQGVPVKCVPSGASRPARRKHQKSVDRHAARRGNRRGRFVQPPPEAAAEAPPPPEAPQPADVTSD